MRRTGLAAGLAAGLALAPGLAAPTIPAPEGQAWKTLSAAFRKRPLPELVAGHLTVAPSAARRHVQRSPFAPPLGQDMILTTAKGGAKSLSPAEGKAFLDRAAADLSRLQASLETGPWDKTLKAADVLSGKLAASIFPSREQRTRAQELSAELEALKRRATLRTAFSKLNPQVTFIIWAPDGKSLAVVNRNVMREGETLGPAILLQIQQQKVLFELDGEKIEVGLR